MSATTDAKGAATILAAHSRGGRAAPPRGQDHSARRRAGRARRRALARSADSAEGRLIGVKKNFTTLTDGAAANFDVIAVGADGARAARKGVAWSLYQGQQ